MAKQRNNLIISTAVVLSPEMSSTLSGIFAKSSKAEPHTRELILLDMDAEAAFDGTKIVAHFPCLLSLCAALSAFFRVSNLLL